MGIKRFFKKAWSGVKKVFKKVGKGIKKVVKKVGKFMDKLGVVGQIALMFALPAVGTWLSKTVGAWATTLTGPGMSAFANGVGTVLNGALKFAQTTGNVYKTITGAVTDFIGTAGKYIGSKFGSTPMTLSDAWSTYSNAVMSKSSHILDPWKEAITITPRDTIGTLASSSGQSAKDFIKDNFDTSGDLYKHMQGLDAKDLKKFKPSIYRTTEQGLSPIFETGPSIAEAITDPSQILTDATGTAAPLGGTPVVRAEIPPVEAPSLLDPQGIRRAGQTAAEGLASEMTITPSSFDPQEVAKHVDPDWIDYLQGYPKRLRQHAVQTVEAAPIKYVQQKMASKDLEDFYAEQELLAGGTGGVPVYEDTPKFGLASSPPPETLGWEYFTGAPNQRLGGSSTDPTGMWGANTWNDSFNKAMRFSRGGIQHG